MNLPDDHRTGAEPATTAATDTTPLASSAAGLSEINPDAAWQALFHSLFEELVLHLHPRGLSMLVRTQQQQSR